MSQYDIYIFILCFIVFTLFTVTFSFLLYHIIKLTKKLIRAGVEDENIIKEAEKARKKGSCLGKTVDCVVSLVLCAILLVFFGFSAYVNFREDTYFEDIPTLKVVRSASMAKVHEKNTALKDAGITNQFDTFDILLVYDKPAAEDLKLYDVVIYEVDDIQLSHRIVGIEEPNNIHPNERYFLLQGDAVDKPDRFPVKYEQIKCIWKGEKIKFVGSFILFMQSPAGWLCIILVIVTMIASPKMEKSLAREKEERLRIIEESAEKEGATV